jgi:hypothetical protein
VLFRILGIYAYVSKCFLIILNVKKSGKFLKVFTAAWCIKYTAESEEVLPAGKNNTMRKDVIFVLSPSPCTHLLPLPPLSLHLPKPDIMFLGWARVQWGGSVNCLFSCN